MDQKVQNYADTAVYTDLDGDKNTVDHEIKPTIVVREFKNCI